MTMKNWESLETRRRRSMPPELRLSADERKWPDDINDQVFLGRAINAIGRSTYGDQWTGDERHASDRLPKIPALPESSRAPVYSIEYAGSVLMRYDQTEYKKYSDLFDDYGNWIVDYGPAAEDSEVTNSLPPAFWTRANTLVIQDEMVLRNKHQRWQHVQLMLLHLLRQGALKASSRSSQRGKFKVLELSVWNVEDLWWRFESCVIDPKRPFQRHISEPSRVHFLYVDKHGLNDAAAGAISNPVTPERYDAFSPYLKLAIQVAIDRQRDPESLKGKKLVDAHVRKHWALSSKASKNAIDAISYVVRDPDTRPEEQRGFHEEEATHRGRSKQNGTSELN